VRLPGPKFSVLKGVNRGPQHSQLRADTWARRGSAADGGPASRRKILRLDDDLYVAMVQWDAGFELPGLDEHGGEEIVYLLQGTVTDQYRSSGAGHCHPR
jgi:hypothetical protein